MSKIGVYFSRHYIWHPLAIIAIIGSLPIAQAGEAVAASERTTFDESTYSVGQIVPVIPGATLMPAGVVYAVPVGASGNALRHPGGCDDSGCSSGANRLRLEFDKPLDRLSLKVGAPGLGFEQCFPENNSCPVWARIVAFDRSGAPVADTRDVLVSDTIEIPQGRLISELSIADTGGRISSALLTLGDGLFDGEHEFDNPAAWGIDDITMSIADGSSAPPLPESPTLRLSSPTPDELVPYPYTLPVVGSVDAPAGLFAFCIRLNNATPPPYEGCNDGGLVQSNGTFSSSLARLRPEPGVNTVYVFAYDIALRLAIAGRAFTLAAAPQPSVEIIEPTPTSIYRSNDEPVNVYARLRAPGGILSYCVSVDVDAIPSQSECSRVPPQEPAFENFYSFVDALPGDRFNRGYNQIRVTMFDKFGQRATEIVTFTRAVNFRIIGLELTQGVQTREGFIQTHFPGAGLVEGPEVLPGSGQYTDNQDYTGTRLVLRGKTILRVFVNHDGRGSLNTKGLSVYVVGAVPRRDGSLRPIGIVFPDYGPTSLDGAPPVLVNSVRNQPLAAYTFVIPRQWHEEIAQVPGGELELRVVVSGGTECLGCSGDNVAWISQVRFDTSPHSALVQPVEIVYRDQNNRLQRPRPADGIFDDIEQIIPHTEDGLSVSPFIGQVDATDLVRAQDAGTMTREQVQSEIFGRVAAFATGANPPDRKVIGVMAPGMNVRGVEAPVTFCCDFKPIPLLRWEPIAIGAEDRPIMSLLHEYLHQHGLYHAGLFCGADLAIGWPPDNKGELQGYGLDRRESRRDPFSRAYRLLTPSAAQPYHDLMSYCAQNEDDAWISPRNWNALGSAFPNGVIPDSVFLGQATATVNLERGEGIVTVSATVLPDGSVNGLRGRYEPLTGYAYSATSSPFTAVVYGSTEEVIARAPMYAPPGAGDAGGLVRQLSAAIDVPEGVSRLEIQRGDAVVVSRRVGVSHPRVTIERPTGYDDDFSAEPFVRVRWNASDDDGDSLEARLEVAAQGGDFRPIMTGLKDDEAMVPATLLDPSEGSRIRVVVSDGYYEAEATTSLETRGPSGLALTLGLMLGICVIIVVLLIRVGNSSS